MSLHYSRTIEQPATKQDGLANAVQIIINCIEAGDNHEALMQAVNLLDDVRSASNPYLIGATKKRKTAPEYRGTVNVD